MLARLTPILLLTASNIFMTTAWYGHLKFKDRPLMRELGIVRYGIVATLFMIQAGVVVKMALRLAFNIKYILVIPNILNI